MGNKIRHSDEVQHQRFQFDLDRSQRIYFTDEIISGTVFCEKSTRASVVLIGTAFWKKERREKFDLRSFEFYRSEFPLRNLMKNQQSFHFRVDEDLPASFHQLEILPNVSYSINLIDRTSKKRLISSIPIQICPRLQIDQPLLLHPFVFGPVQHHDYETQFQVKFNRAAYTFHDFIQLSYELKNPRHIFIDRIETNLAIFYRIESDIYQEDISDGIHTDRPIQSTRAKFRRNQVSINIPNEFYLPPTHHRHYHRMKDNKGFETSVEYKIQIRIFLTESDDLWQIDVPIVIGHDLVVRKNPRHFNLRLLS